MIDLQEPHPCLGRWSRIFAKSVLRRIYLFSVVLFGICVTSPFFLRTVWQVTTLKWLRPASSCCTADRLLLWPRSKNNTTHITQYLYLDSWWQSSRLFYTWIHTVLIICLIPFLSYSTDHYCARANLLPGSRNSYFAHIISTDTLRIGSQIFSQIRFWNTTPKDLEWCSPISSGSTSSSTIPNVHESVFF